MLEISAAWFVSDFWEDQLVEHGRQYLFLVFVGFIGSFGFIRLSTRLMRSPRVPWWPGSVVSEGGVHVHHLAFGIVLMMGAGVVSFALLETGWWYEVCAVLFGIGIGLTIDEFALWIYLDDVYWSRERRSSIDATLIAVAFMGLILVGGVSFDVAAPAPFDVIATVVAVIALLAVSMICFLKQRVFHGAMGLLVPLVGIYGAVRIAKPLTVGAAILRRSEAGQAGEGGAPVPQRPSHGAPQGAVPRCGRRRDRRGVRGSAEADGHGGRDQAQGTLTCAGSVSGRGLPER